MKDWTIGCITSRVICSTTEIFFHRRLEKQVRKQEAIARLRGTQYAPSAERSQKPKINEDPKTKLARLVDPGTSEAIKDKKEFGTIVRDPPPTSSPSTSSYVEMPPSPSQIPSSSNLERITQRSPSDDVQPTLPLPSASSASLRKWTLPLPPPVAVRPLPVHKISGLGSDLLGYRWLPPKSPDPYSFSLPDIPGPQDRNPLTLSVLPNPIEPPSSSFPSRSAPKEHSRALSRWGNRFRVEKDRRRTTSMRGPKRIDPATFHPSFRRTRVANDADAPPSADGEIPEATENRVQRSEPLPWDTDIPAAESR